MRDAAPSRPSGGQLLRLLAVLVDLGQRPHEAGPLVRLGDADLLKGNDTTQSVTEGRVGAVERSRTEPTSCLLTRIQTMGTVEY